MIRNMTTPEISLRPAEKHDADAIAAIYAPIVRDTFISFETEPPSPAVMAERIATTQQRYPWLVATTGEGAGDAVVGYAYGSALRPRAAYQWSVEVTAYVAESARGQGVGRRLYRGLFTVLRAQGFHAAFAGVALPNDASVALHEAVGFEPLGTYREVGFKFGAWRDVGWWRLALADAATPPAELVSFPQLRETPAFARLLA
jgi:L-amino acid N-acyltransferase YncA